MKIGITYKAEKKKVKKKFEHSSVGKLTYKLQPLHHRLVLADSIVIEVLPSLDGLLLVHLHLAGRLLPLGDDAGGLGVLPLVQQQVGGL